MKTPKHSYLHGCTVLLFMSATLIVPRLSTMCLAAQAIEGAPDPPNEQPLTLRERMQRAVLRQADSVGRMQRSIDLQRHSTLRQTGESSDASSFFMLPAPARMVPPSAVGGDQGNEGDSETDGQDKDKDDKKDDQSADRQVVSLGSGSSQQRAALALPGALSGQSSIGSLVPVAGVGDLSLEEMLLRQMAGGETQNTAGVFQTGVLQTGVLQQGSDRQSLLPVSGKPAAGSLDYIRQILNFSMDGPALFRGFSGE